MNGIIALRAGYDSMLLPVDHLLAGLVFGGLGETQLF